jgi:hypothetical protein
MRIVHEIHYGKAQIGAGGKPYSPPVGENVGRRLQAEVLISVPVPEGGIGPEEGIHIEGDGGHIIRALRLAADLLEENGRAYVEAGKLDPGWLDGD